MLSPDNVVAEPRTDASAVWEAVLLELEDYLEHVESLLEDDGERDMAAWDPPVGMPALPASLAERAIALESRQRRALERLTHELMANRQQSTAATGYLSGATAVPQFCDHSV